MFALINFYDYEHEFLIDWLIKFKNIRYVSLRFIDLIGLTVVLDY